MVRRATSADAAAVHELVQRAYAHYVPRMNRRPAPMDRDYTNAHAWVATTDDRIVGVVVIEVHADHLLIENLAVDPAAQGRGIGVRLLEVAEHHARELGLREVRLYTNAVMTENIAFYPRRGYRETGREQQHGFGRVFFSKSW